MREDGSEISNQEIWIFHESGSLFSELNNLLVSSFLHLSSLSINETGTKVNSSKFRVARSSFPKLCQQFQNCFFMFSFGLGDLEFFDMDELKDC